MKIEDQIELIKNVCDKLNAHTGLNYILSSFMLHSTWFSFELINENHVVGFYSHDGKIFMFYKEKFIDFFTALKNAGVNMV